MRKLRFRFYFIFLNRMLADYNTAVAKLSRKLRFRFYFIFLNRMLADYNTTVAKLSRKLRFNIPVATKARRRPPWTDGQPSLFINVCVYHMRHSLSSAD